jgi:Cu(I)/Ag(I) efflux system membrane fusion protein
MNRSARTFLILAAISAAGIGGFFVGRPGGRSVADVASTATAPTGAVIYYQDPDGKPQYSAQPAKTADGRPYRAVLASEDLNFDPATKTAGAVAPDSKRVLYYRNPMGLPDVSSTPKKDSMGMDYIAVYDGEEADPSSVKLSPGKLQRAGVATEAASLQILATPVRAPGTIQLDERRISVITVRTESFVDTVEDVTTGTEVRKGQPLLRLYSPQIALAAADYLTTLNMPASPSGASGAAGSRQRLLNYAAPPGLMAQIEKTRQVPITFTWEAPRDGIVLERNVSDGMRVRPGEVLFRIADHSTVWVLVDVAERDLANVAENQPAIVRVRSYPGRTFAGKVALVYPHLSPATRTVRVRIELPNHNLLLRPDMYAEAEINTGTNVPVLTVPDSAVIDSGSRQLVLVDKGDGRFEPRPVKLGRHGTGYVEILEGLTDSEVVVTSANFLIDAESNLNSALKGLSDASAPQ